MRSAEKRLDEMNRLADMLHFPATVNAGATLNVMVTIALTWVLAPLYFAFVGSWIALVLAVNLAPVILLRLTLKPTTTYPRLKDMSFVHDQHKFSDWVYLAASANMTFWILLAWTLLAKTYGARTHAIMAFVALEVAAFLLTFSPVLFRKALNR